MNRVILKGRVAKDPDVKTTQRGQTFTRITISVDKYAIRRNSWQSISRRARKSCAKGGFKRAVIRTKTARKSIRPTLFLIASSFAGARRKLTMRSLYRSNGRNRTRQD